MAKKTFELSLAELEDITRELDNNELSLDDSLKKFDKGMELIKFCSTKLDQAQKKVDLLLQKDGEIKTEPFNNDTGETS